jgi:hypothetical protein
VLLGEVGRIGEDEQNLVCNSCGKAFCGPLKTAVFTSCGHHFHRECFAWLLANLCVDCPVCGGRMFKKPT